jgi:uncharacterized phage-associated protein
MPLIFRPNLDKIVELLLYLAHKRPNADKYQAVKFFYLADREHLNRFGRPITSDTYYALEYGPVASIAKDLLEQQRGALSAANISELPFEVEIAPNKKGRELLYIRGPKREVNFSLFSKSDMAVFDEILTKYGNLSFDELYEITHAHFAYSRAWNNRKAGLNHAPMRYEDMIEDESRRADIIEDMAPVAGHLE